MHTDNSVTLHDGETGAANGVLLELDPVLGGTVGIHIIEADGTHNFEGTVDGDNWATVQAEQLSDGDFVGSTTSTGLYRIETSGLAAIRDRISSPGGGANTVKALAKAG